MTTRGYPTIDLKKRVRRVYAPAEHVPSIEQKLRKVFGHDKFEVIAMEALDNIPDPGVLGSSRLNTYKHLQHPEKEMAKVEKAYEVAIRDGRAVDATFLLKEMGKQ